MQTGGLVHPEILYDAFFFLRIFCAQFIHLSVCNLLNFEAKVLAMGHLV